MSGVHVLPVVEENPVARLRETVDALEIYLELIQDESSDGYAPLAGCRQYLERIRSYSQATLRGDATTLPMTDVETSTSHAVSEGETRLQELFSAMFANSPDPVACLRGDAIVACNPRCLELCRTNSIELDATISHRPLQESCQYDVARVAVRVQEVDYELLWFREKLLTNAPSWAGLPSMGMLCPW